MIHVSYQILHWILWQNQFYIIIISAENISLLRRMYILSRWQWNCYTENFLSQKLIQENSSKISLFYYFPLDINSKTLISNISAFYTYLILKRGWKGNPATIASNNNVFLIEILRLYFTTSIEIYFSNFPRETFCRFYSYTLTEGMIHSSDN